jgi:UDP-N-acetylglucosamine 2-epimerase (non-hydrolysing)
VKIVSIVGARPQFVKVAPVDEELTRRGHEHLIVHTGQHYDYEMSKAFFEQLSIPEPDYNLEVGSGTHAYQTGQMLSRLGETLAEEAPDLVLVYGDTNSTLAGALAAVKLLIPVAHVESGYRSFDMTMPEEINRIVADRVSQLHFAPTKTAVQNLIKEGLPEETIYLTGDIMAETLLKNLEKARASSALEDLGLEPRSYILMTLHRQENTDDPARLERIFTGLATSPLPIIFACHPRTQKRLAEFKTLEKAHYDPEKLTIIKPLPYLDFIKLEMEAAFVVTDSGGVQEEALVLGKPCVTLRYNTERVETIEAGANVLVGAEPDLIEQAIKRSLAIVEEYGDRHPFEMPDAWDDQVSRRIAEAIETNTIYTTRLTIPNSF